MSGKTGQLVSLGGSSPADEAAEALQFQDFSTQQGNGNFYASPPPLQPPLPNSTGAPVPPATAQGFWTLEYYKQYFDVDSVEVGERIAATVLPNKDFFSLIAVNPDLYGPFWIPTTLIFVLFAVTTISESLQALWSNKDYVYDLTALSWAISTVYAFVVFIPLILWGICAFYKVPLKLLELMNIYGYGLAIWIPVSFLCIVNVEILKWVLVSVAFASTTLFKLKALKPALITPQGPNVSALMTMGLVVLVSQAALAILFKVIFFQYIAIASGGAPAGSSGPKNGTAT